MHPAAQPLQMKSTPCWPGPSERSELTTCASDCIRSEHANVDTTHAALSEFQIKTSEMASCISAVHDEQRPPKLPSNADREAKTKGDPETRRRNAIRNPEPPTAACRNSTEAPRLTTMHLKETTAETRANRQERNLQRRECKTLVTKASKRQHANDQDLALENCEPDVVHEKVVHEDTTPRGNQIADRKPYGSSNATKGWEDNAIQKSK